MGEAAQLITAVAALVTAIGSVTIGIIAASLSLVRQRDAAAKEATRLTRSHGGDSPDGDDDGPSQTPHRHRARRPPVNEGDEFVRRAREVARDAQDLALEAGREQRFDSIERRLDGPSSDEGDQHAGGADA